jgi:hypothetical protein
MFAALETLEKVADNVFNRITARVCDISLAFYSRVFPFLLCRQTYPSAHLSDVQVVEDRDRLISLNTRINTARAKVQKIVGTRNATCVFSVFVQCLHRIESHSLCIQCISSWMDLHFGCLCRAISDMTHPLTLRQRQVPR